MRLPFACEEDMPKTEEPLPWAATRASLREPYPRKNIYFTDEGADEVYDFCIWQTHVAHYEQLTGRAARSSSGFINDLLLRAYLKSMLDPGNREAFTAWRTAEYEVAGGIVRPAPPRPGFLLPMAIIECRFSLQSEAEAPSQVGLHELEPLREMARREMEVLRHDPEMRRSKRRQPDEPG
jgi:hypothetical protein